MKTLTYKIAADGRAVRAALVQKYPAWRGTPITFQGMQVFAHPLIRIHTRPGEIIVTCPDDADEKVIEAVVKEAPLRSRKPGPFDGANRRK